MGTTIVALYIWSTVAMGGQSPVARMDWVYQGQFASMSHCEDAVRKLYGENDPGKTRCIDTGIKVSK